MGHQNYILIGINLLNCMFIRFVTLINYLTAYFTLCGEKIQNHKLDFTYYQIVKHKTEES